MIARQSILGRDTERLIALARVVLAAASAFAAYSEPPGPARGWFLLLTTAYGLVGATVLVTQSGLGRPKLAKALHVTDLVFTVAMAFSPAGLAYFLILATFCMLSSVIQWRWPVTLGTGAVFIGIYVSTVALGLASSERFTIRATYLLLVPIGLSLAARNAQASRMRLLKLARWSSARYSEYGNAVLRVFQHAADVLEAQDVIVFYQEVDHPKGFKAIYRVTGDRLETQECDTWASETVAAELDGKSFLVVAPEEHLCLTYDGMRRVLNPAPAVSMSQDSGVVASAPFTGDFCNGRLFACGVKNWRWDQLVLVEIVASHVRSRLEGRALRDRAARMTAELERMRLSRDLHDGILQSLTAARLQLKALMKDAPQEREERMHMIADLLQEEQQRLREFIENTRAAPGELVPVERIAQRIATVAEHWRLRAEISLNCKEAEIPSALYREIYFMVGEAIANSARHGRATAVTASLRCGEGRLVLTLEEQDGKAGRQDLRGMAPRSIEERIRELGGSLALSNGPAGVSLRLEIPLNA